MIKNTDGIIRGSKNFNITILENHRIRKISNHWNCSLSPGYFKLDKKHACYIRIYLKASYDYHELRNDIDTWYKVEYIKKQQKIRLYNLIPITSNHEIVELETCIH